MNIIQVNSTADFHKLDKSIQLAIKNNDGYTPCGFPPYILAVQNDQVFCKTPDDIFFKSISDNQIMCNCGNISFSIIIEDYSCIATCSRCGAKEEVYSG